MTHSWVLPGSSYRIARWYDGAAKEKHRHIHSAHVRVLLDRWLDTHRLILRKIHEALEGNPSLRLSSCGASPSDARLREDLAAAFVSGRLVALTDEQQAPPREAGDKASDSTPVLGIAAQSLEAAVTRQAPTARGGGGTPGKGSSAKPLVLETPVRAYGIAYKTEGVILREKPLPHARKVCQLAFNARVFVDSTHQGWCLVTLEDGRFGYCVATQLKTNLPEPHAKIHWIQPGETALTITRRYYGGQAVWGSDHRFYVNGLVYANQGQGPRGIYLENPGDTWDGAQVRSGMMIWIPSLAFMKSLRGKVSSGSITYAAWGATVSGLQVVADFAYGSAAFIAGLLHGAGESLWDVLVGLKDLAVMLWDVVVSLFTGNLLSDAAGLWRDVSGLDWKALVQGWVEDFTAKWNAEDMFDRWHFRGWVVGYVIMEVLMLVFSGGIVQGIKWVGKASKVSKVLKGLPQVQKLAEAVKGHKAYKTVARVMERGAEIASTAEEAKKWVAKLVTRPKSIWGKSPEQLVDVFRKAGYEVVVEQSTKSSKLSKQIRIKSGSIQNIQVHPGGGSKGGAYYKISHDKGKLKVVDRATYIPGKGETATIIYVDVGLQGWMLQAAVANSAAQKLGHSLDEEEEE